MGGLEKIECWWRQELEENYTWQYGESCYLFAASNTSSYVTLRSSHLSTFTLDWSYEFLTSSILESPLDIYWALYETPEDVAVVAYFQISLLSFYIFALAALIYFCIKYWEVVKLQIQEERNRQKLKKQRKDELRMSRMEQIKLSRAKYTESSEKVDMDTY